MKTVFAVGIAAVVWVAHPGAQIGSIAGRIGQAKDAVETADKTIRDIKFSDQEEQQLGAEVSAKLRDRYGVVQDEAVHKYVTLVGTAVAQGSTRPNGPWTFIVLDTDGVNAFAAPGGFVHITRGALTMIPNEAELADVLAHEIVHVTSRHTIRAIQKTKVEGALASAATREAFLKEAGNKLYSMTLENSFDRGDEMDSDRLGVALANKAGYNPAGLGDFLTRVADRNKNATERSGLFASHPETQARLAELAKTIKAQRLLSTATVQPRYSASISYRPVGGSGMYGVSGMSALGREKTNSSTIASAGSRGVNPDRDARGGPDKGLVTVTVTAEDVAAFKKGISGQTT